MGGLRCQGVGGVLVVGCAGGALVHLRGVAVVARAVVLEALQVLGVLAVVALMVAACLKVQGVW